MELGFNLDEKFEKIVKRKVMYQSGSMGFNLLITRMQKRYSANPTEEVLKGAIKEMHDFYEKYRSILTKELEIFKRM